MSALKTIYLAIKEKLEASETAFTSKGLSPIRHIDRYKGQYNLMEEYDGFEVPAVFVEISVDWKDNGGGNQEGEANVILHIITEYTYDSTGNEQERGLEDYDIYQTVHELLQDLSTDCSTKMRRIRESSEPQPNELHAHLVTYRCAIDDQSTNRVNKLETREVEAIEVLDGVQRVYISA